MTSEGGNAWNRIRYSLWSPFYDLVARALRPARRRSIALLDPRPGERILIVGAGTGEDLPLLPEGVQVLATDLTPAMLARARSKARPGQELRVMDGQALALEDGTFDAVILHLILAVIPDPGRCLREAARVLRPGGRIAVFDKFVPDGAQPSRGRRALNLVTAALFTSITRRLGDILTAAAVPLVVVRDEPVAFGGAFRVIVLRKPGNG